MSCDFSDNKASRRFFPFRVSVRLLFMLALAILLGCGGSNAGSPVSGNPSGSAGSDSPAVPSSGKITRFAYIGLFDSREIRGFRLDPNTGATAPLASSPVATSGIAPSRLIADPEGRFLYVAGSPQSAQSNVSLGYDLLGYKINQSTGALTPISGLPKHAQVGDLAISTNGTFLYALQFIGGFSRLATYRIDQNSGTLVPALAEPIPQHFGFILAIDPLGRFLYSVVPQSTSTFIFVYALDQQTGTPTAVPGSPFMPQITGLISAVADPQGRFLYTAAQRITAQLDAEQVGSTGALTPVPGSPFATAQSPLLKLAIDPHGSFLYASAADGAGIYAFAIQSNGGLRPVLGSPFAKGAILAGLTVDQSGKYLFGALDAGVLGYAINETTGVLTPLPNNPPLGNAEHNAIVTVAY